jgi:hypothetical protein
MSNQELLLEKFYSYRKGHKTIMEQVWAHVDRLDEAVLGSIHKASLFMGPDDIAFLQQFPRRYWIQALDQRYNNTKDGFQSLFNYLKDLQVKRDSVYKADFDKHLEDERRQFGSNPDYAGLSPKMREELARKHARVLAKRESFDKVTTDENLPVDKAQVFTFNMKGKKQESFKANPMLAPLVKKLEGTIDNEDGYDLSHPTVIEKKREGKAPILQNKTDGFNFPNFDTISEVLPEYLKLHAHGIIKYDPEEIENSKTMSDKNDSNPDGSTDNYTYKLALNDLIKKHKARLKREFPVEYKGSAAKLEKDAKTAATEELKQLISDGKIVTPRGEKLELDASGKPIHPDLMLPHKEVTITRINSAGNEEEIKVMNPVVSSGHFYRRITKAESDLIDKVQDVGGDLTKLSEEEKNSYLNLTKYLRGQHFDIHTGRVKPIYLNSHGEMDLKHSRQGSDHSRAGGFHSNNDSDLKIFLSKYGKNRETYNQKIKTLFENDPEGESLKDEIEKDIEMQLRLGSKKDTFDTIVERMVLRGAIKQLTKMAFIRILENLGVPHIEERNKTGSNVRLKFIKSLIDHLEQQDLGRGSRRTRMSRRLIFTGTIEDIRSYSDSVVCRPDKRRLGSSRCGFRYDLDELLDIGREAIAIAAKAASAIDSGEELSADDLETELLHLKSAFEQGLMALELSFYEVAKMSGLGEMEAFAQAKKNVEIFLDELAKTPDMSTKAMLGSIQSKIESNVDSVVPPEARKEEEPTTQAPAAPSPAVPSAEISRDILDIMKTQLAANPRNHEAILKTTVEKMGKRFPDETPVQLKALADEAKSNIAKAVNNLNRIMSSNLYFSINPTELKMVEKEQLQALLDAMKKYVSDKPHLLAAYKRKMDDVESELKSRG